MNTEAFEEKLAKAKNYAYRLLTYRARSCYEVRERLKRKGFSQKLIDKTVEELKKLNYLNDENFASMWVDVRLSTNPCGRRLAEQELRKKGIDEKIVSNITETYFNENSERKIAHELALRKVRKYTGIDNAKNRKKLCDFLARRGFPLEIVYEVLGEVFQE